MNVEELIKLLEKCPKDAKVAVYASLAEDSDIANGVKILNKKEGPYNKSDDVWFMYNIPEEEKIVFIM